MCSGSPYHNVRKDFQHINLHVQGETNYELFVCHAMHLLKN
jgi:hypothetical protein